MMTYCISNNETILQNVKEKNYNISPIYLNTLCDISDFFAEIIQKPENTNIIVIFYDNNDNFDKIQDLCNTLEISNEDICIVSRTNACKQSIFQGSYLEKVHSFEEKCISSILFPEIIDPYSSFFSVKSNVLINKISDKQKYHSLPDILGKCKWETIEEIQLQPINSCTTHKNTSYHSLVQIINTLMQGINLSVFAVLHHESHIWKEIKRALKFLTVGVSGTFVNTSVLFLLTEYAGLYYIFSSLIAIETSIVTNFLLNDYWTFGEKHNNISKKHMRFLSYQLICTAGLLINITILFLLTNLTNMWYIYANIIAIICVFIWDFLVNRNITWKYKSGGP